MKILLIGSVELSSRILEKLILMNTEIVGVCTKNSSSLNSDYVDLTPMCLQNDIPFKLSDDVNSVDSIDWIRKLKPDIIFCFGWSYLIKKELLNLAPMGVIGFHPANLPCNRGRHPIIWALALGLEDTASTFFLMDEKIDNGSIISQKKIYISYADDAQILYQKIIDAAVLQLESLIPKLESKTYKKISQDASLANFWRKRKKKDGLIDFRMTSDAIYNLVRSLTKPYVGAHVEYGGLDVVIWKVAEVDYRKNNIEPGKILDVNDSTILVKTYDGAIRIIEHEFDNLPRIGSYI